MCAPWRVSALCACRGGTRVRAMCDGDGGGADVLCEGEVRGACARVRARCVRERRDTERARRGSGCLCLRLLCILRLGGARYECAGAVRVGTGAMAFRVHPPSSISYSTSQNPSRSVF